MRRAFLISSLAVCLLACGNNNPDNPASQTDSSSAPSPSGNTQRDPDTHSSSENAAGTGTGPGTGVAPLGENTPSNKAQMDSGGIRPDTTAGNRQ